MRPNHVAIAAMTMLSIAGTLTASAQTQRGGGGETQKIMQQYQQLAAEKSALQAQVAQMKKDLDAAKAETAAIKKERDGLKQRAGGSPAALTLVTNARLAAEQALEQSKQRMTELVARFRETNQNLKEVETGRNTARKELAERNAAFDSCAENNLQLFEITSDVLNRYSHVGLFTRVSAAEPFTKITRTRIENLVDEYRTRAEELRVKRPKK